MRCEIYCLLALAVVAAFAEELIAAPKVITEDRSFISTSSFNFTTFTLIKYSTTTTSTFTSLITCSTSTSTLTACTSSGRRRRSFFFHDGEGKLSQHQRGTRGLFYDEDNSSIFLPSVVERSDPVQEVVPPIKNPNDSVVPLEVESGFDLPSELSATRFLLAFGTSTSTSVTVTTSTRSLTAICSSTTSYILCGSTGK